MYRLPSRNRNELTVAASTEHLKIARPKIYFWTNLAPILLISEKFGRIFFSGDLSLHPEWNMKRSVDHYFRNERKKPVLPPFFRGKPRSREKRDLGRREAKKKNDLIYGSAAAVFTLLPRLPLPLLVFFPSCLHSFFAAELSFKLLYVLGRNSCHSKPVSFDTGTCLCGRSCAGHKKIILSWSHFRMIH